jgi:methylated-DNA-[protein]-cysteine S-methyltransferase
MHIDSRAGVNDTPRSGPELIYYTYFDSPADRLLLAGTREQLLLIAFSSGKRARGADLEWERWDKPFVSVKAQLTEYFDGQRQQFDLLLAPFGTPFQLKVWRALQRIPFGETRTYGAIARDIGHPKAVRAVGAANGRNPLPIVIPCHRVIGHDGTLTGFGGGLETKRRLLALEQRHSGLFVAKGTQAVER